MVEVEDEEPFAQFWQVRVEGKEKTDRVGPAGAGYADVGPEGRGSAYFRNGAAVQARCGKKVFKGCRVFLRLRSNTPATGRSCCGVRRFGKL